MSVNIEWTINSVERETKDGFIYAIHYTVGANDGTYSAGGYGSVPLDRPETLVPYSELSEETVLGWLKEKLGGPEKVAEIEAALTKNLNEQRTPTTASGLPWNK